MAQEPCILVVDDERRWARLFEEILSPGFHVQTAYSAVEAVQFIAEHEKDIGFAIVDIRLEGHQDYIGLGLIYELRYRNIPCLATTAFGDESAYVVRDALVRGGVNDVLFKSKLDPTELRETVQQAMSPPNHMTQSKERYAPEMVGAFRELSRDLDHRINSPLAIIRNRCALLRRRLKDIPPDVLEYFEKGIGEIEESVEDAIANVGRAQQRSRDLASLLALPSDSNDDGAL